MVGWDEENVSKRNMSTKVKVFLHHVSSNLHSAQRIPTVTAEETEHKLMDSIQQTLVACLLCEMLCT